MRIDKDTIDLNFKVAVAKKTTVEGSTVYTPVKKEFILDVSTNSRITISKPYLDVKENKVAARVEVDFVNIADNELCLGNIKDDGSFEPYNLICSFVSFSKAINYQLWQEPKNNTIFYTHNINGYNLEHCRNNLAIKAVTIGAKFDTDEGFRSNNSSPTTSTGLHYFGKFKDDLTSLNANKDIKPHLAVINLPGISNESNPFEASFTGNDKFGDIKLDSPAPVAVLELPYGTTDVLESIDNLHPMDVYTARLSSDTVYVLETNISYNPDRMFIILPVL